MFTKKNPAVKPSHKGRLHEALGIPQGETIPLRDLMKAKKSKNKHVASMARYADTMRGWSK